MARIAKLPVIPYPATEENLISDGLLIMRQGDQDTPINQDVMVASVDNGIYAFGVGSGSSFNYNLDLYYGYKSHVRDIGDVRGLVTLVYDGGGTSGLNLLPFIPYYEAFDGAYLFALKATPGYNRPTSNSIITSGYPTIRDAFADMDFVSRYGIPITYRLSNCTAISAPTQAYVGEIVRVPIDFPAGYGIVNPTTDVYVTNNGVTIPSTYSGGALTFTMPDPS